MPRNGFPSNTPSKARFRRRRGLGKPVNVSTGAVKYSGAISQANTDSAVITLYDDAQLSSDMTGLITGRFNNNPSSARNWTEMSTSWGEYRVLGIRFSYLPRFAVNTATVGGFAGYHSIIHGTPIVPTTVSMASSNGMSRIWSAWKPFVREWRMSEIDEAAFIDTSAPAATSNCLDVLAVGGTASLAYGNMQIEYLVQFRVHAL